MNVAHVNQQQQVTDDIARVFRLADLAKAGVLDDQERAFLETIETHRVGSAVEHEVVAGTGIQPEAQSRRLTLNDHQRGRADAILQAHGG